MAIKLLNQILTNLRSPCVRAPRDSNLFATMDANRRSPPRLVKSSLQRKQIFELIHPLEITLTIYLLQLMPFYLIRNRIDQNVTNDEH